jgi:protein TonB
MKFQTLTIKCGGWLPVRLALQILDQASAWAMPLKGRASSGDNARLKMMRRCEEPSEQGDYSDFAFLKPGVVVSFPKRLGKEALDFAVGLAQDPKGHFNPCTPETMVGEDRKKRIKAGVVTAGVSYSVVLAAVYFSYTDSRQLQQAPRLECPDRVVLLAQLPAVSEAPALSKPAPVALHQSGLARPAPPAERALAASALAAATTADVATKEVPKLEDSQLNVPGTASPRGLSGTVNGEDGAVRAGSPAPGAPAAGGTAAPTSYDGVFSASKVSSRPRILSRPLPGYTDDARRSQVEGTVKVSVVLRSDGTVGDVTIVSGLGHGLDERAVDAVRQLQFIPAEKDGHKVSVRVFLEFRFSLL